MRRKLKRYLEDRFWRLHMKIAGVPEGEKGTDGKVINKEIIQ